jgi:predicted enzyme related to lactoylglutathione lyase
MISGVHTILYSPRAEALRAFFRDVLKFRHVDAGRGWLIFAAPPGEIAVHPTDERGSHELYLMCTDIRKTVADLEKKGVDFTTPINEQGWGLLTHLKLPDGETLGLYEPRHKVAISMNASGLPPRKKRPTRIKKARPRARKPSRKRR